MARSGSFSPDIAAAGWFDEQAPANGWFDDDLLSLPPAAGFVSLAMVELGGIGQADSAAAATETATAAETVSAISTQPAAITNAATATDAPSALSTQPAVSAEAATASEAASAIATEVAAITEAVTASEANNGSSGVPGFFSLMSLELGGGGSPDVSVVAEAATASEATSAVLLSPRSVTEATTATAAHDGNNASLAGFFSLMELEIGGAGVSPNAVSIAESASASDASDATFLNVPAQPVWQPVHAAWFADPGVVALYMLQQTGLSVALRSGNVQPATQADPAFAANNQSATAVQLAARTEAATATDAASATSSFAGSDSVTEAANAAEACDATAVRVSGVIEVAAAVETSARAAATFADCLETATPIVIHDAIGGSAPTVIHGRRAVSRGNQLRRTAPPSLRRN